MPARFEQAEQLKKQYTDKFVVVKSEVPELRRFSGLTGVVKTVNMSGRALVLFDGPADIGWYDIDPTFLTVVDAPVPKKSAAPAEGKAVTKEAPAAKAAPAAGEKKLSPLDMIRQQGAAGSKPAAPAAGGAKPSPLDLIRQQGAAKAGGAASTPAAATKVAAAPSAEGKKLSPLEMIRQQGAAKPSGAAKPAAAESAPSVPDAAPVPEPVATSKPAAPPADGKKLSPLEMIRQQGAFKGNK